MSSNIKKILITGGHHTSALPVIELLRVENNVSILWVGHKHSTVRDKNETLEYKEITALGIPFKNLMAGKFYRSYNIYNLFKIPMGFFHAFFILLREKPDSILSFGGYLAVPVVFMGWLLGIPSYTHEQTVVAGYANKFISKFAKKIFISWQQSESHFPKDKVIYAGLPLRDEIFNVSSNNFNFSNNLPTIYITAGKTGSHKINNVIEESLSELLKFTNIIHQTGDHSQFKDYERISLLYSKISNNSSGEYIYRKFVLKGEIGEAYSKSTLIVGRAGAHTSAEILSLEKPALLIPISWVSHNEQLENAKVVRDSGLAEILEEKDISSSVFIEKIQTMLNNIDNYKISPEARIEKKNSARIIVNEIFKEE